MVPINVTSKLGGRERVVAVAVVVVLSVTLPPSLPPPPLPPPPYPILPKITSAGTTTTRQASNNVTPNKWKRGWGVGGGVGAWGVGGEVEGKGLGSGEEGGGLGRRN